MYWYLIIIPSRQENPAVSSPFLCTSDKFGTGYNVFQHMRFTKGRNTSNDIDRIHQLALVLFVRAVWSVREPSWSSRLWFSYTFDRYLTPMHFVMCVPVQKYKRHRTCNSIVHIYLTRRYSTILYQLPTLFVLDEWAWLEAIFGVHTTAITKHRQLQ